MGCLPFSEALYRDLQQQGLDAGDLWSEPGRYGRKERWFRNSEALEDDLRWLISVGVLRREVDGQGLTSRFRLTPWVASFWMKILQSCSVRSQCWIDCVTACVGTGRCNANHSSPSHGAWHLKRGWQITDDGGVMPSAPTTGRTGAALQGAKHEQQRLGGCRWR